MKRSLFAPLASVSRRQWLRGVGAALVAAPVVSLVGCNKDGANGSGSNDMAASSNDLAGADLSGVSGGSAWATGGTAAMTDKASYPDPFPAAAAACALTCEATIGPCHTTSPERQDVSDGWDGCPVRMSFRVVDEDCNPVEDAIVEIWHTNYKGVYSGQIASICNTAQADKQAGYFRGYQRTDADGRCDFDSVFPGWYSGRAIHVHLRVMKGAYNGSDTASNAWEITQLFWSDTFVKEFFAAQPLYKDFGTPDTLLTNDNVVGNASDITPYVFEISRMTDGAMLAAKTLVLRKSQNDSSCDI